jgi:DNA-binding winged helix-turn-helix (wHTH) protein
LSEFTVSTVPVVLVYRIGDMEVDVARAFLRRGADEIRLKPKTFQLLLHLIANRDRLVSRDELMEVFWPGTAVTDDSLAQVISELRRALGDSSRDPRFLQTVPKMGYRFVAPVEEVRPAVVLAREEITTVEIREEYSDDPPSRLLAAPRRRVLWPAALAMVSILAAAAWVVGATRNHGPPPAPAGKRQIAILPFENRSGGDDLDWLRDGLPDMLTAALAHSRGLDVLSREQVQHWIGRAVTDRGSPAPSRSPAAVTPS